MKLTIDHQITVRVIQGQPDSEVLKLLKELKIINTNIMAKQEQFDAVITRIDAATTAIADQLRDLKEQLTNAGLSAEVEAAVLARLETSATQLEAVGKDPENPVPEIPPAPPIPEA